MLVKAFPSTLTGLGEDDTGYVPQYAIDPVLSVSSDPLMPLGSGGVDISSLLTSPGSITAQQAAQSSAALGLPAASSGMNWSSLLSQLIGTAGAVATKDIQSGSTVITYPNGSQVAVPAGQQVPNLPSTLGISSSGLFGSTSSSGLLIVGVAAVVLMLVMSKGR